MNLEIKKYNDKDDWVNAISESIETNIKQLCLVYDEVNMLLSGGSTPGPVYRKLDKEIPSFMQLRIGLVDERFVPVNDDQSNEKLLKNCFNTRSAKEYTIVGMVKDETNEQTNLEEVGHAYSPFFDRTDVVILGMGGDGHTASIFPFDPESEIVKKNGVKGVFSTKAPEAPKKRITCSMHLICSAQYIYLLISGAEKLKVLKDYEFQYPIHNVLERRPDVKIYYLEK